VPKLLLGYALVAKLQLRSLHSLKCRLFTDFEKRLEHHSHRWQRIRMTADEVLAGVASMRAKIGSESKPVLAEMLAARFTAGKSLKFKRPWPKQT